MLFYFGGLFNFVYLKFMFLWCVAHDDGFYAELV